MAISRAKLNQALALVEAAAVAGQRCPTNDQFGNHNALTELAREQRIFVEVYPHNFRVVEILKGPNRGKRTQAPSNPSWRPYLTVGVETLRHDRAGGTIRLTASAQVATTERPQPSMPRPLSRAEMEKL